MNNPRKSLLILGAGGLLGSVLSNNTHLCDWNIIKHSRTLKNGVNADLRDESTTHQMLDGIDPNAIINLVGMTNVDECEQNPSQSYLINVKTVENITKWIGRSKKDVYLVHISTDQVYDGIGPHSEENVKLSNYYAFSKYIGELVASTVGGVILRTNFFGKTKHETRISFTDWLFNSLKNKHSIQVFDDVIFSPLSMSTLSEMINVVIGRRSTGIFNVGSRDGLSKADFAYLFAEELALSTESVTRTTVSKVTSLKAYRPKDMRMKVDRFEGTHGIKMPSLREEIKRVAWEYKCET